MKRDLNRLSERSYDLTIIGGGIYGACAAWEGVLRGLSVCLLEKDDFANATSSNSLRIVHGGLRYLQHLDFKRMRESIRERNVLMQIAPHLVNPLPFVMPTYGHGLRGREVMSVALWLNDLVGFDHNFGIDPQNQLLRGRIVSRRECTELVPGIDQRHLTGGALWHDAQVHNPERLLLAFLKSATAAGAEAANYVEVTGFIEKDKHVMGVKATDRLSSHHLDIHSKIVLNATGPWVDVLLGSLKSARPSKRFHLSKAMNLVTRQIFRHHAVGIPCPASFRDTDAFLNKGSRLFFIVPWQNYSLIGTRHFRYQGDQADFRITDPDIELFLGEINRAYPPAALSRQDVLRAYGGMLPESPGSDGPEVQLEKHYQLIDHLDEDGIDGLVTIVGVKWTTARHVAERTLDLIFKKLGRKSKGNRSSERRVAGGEFGRLDNLLAQHKERRLHSLSEASMLHLLRNHGTLHSEVLQHIAEDPSLSETLAETSPVIKAEVIHAVRQEMAQHLADVVMRRTELSAGGHPGTSVLESCAELMAKEMSWDLARVRQELDWVSEALHRAGAFEPAYPVR